VRVIVRFRPHDFIGPIPVLKYDKADSAESHAPGNNSMIQTLGLAQNPQKREIEPPRPADNKVAEGNRNAEVGRVRPRGKSMIQTLAFAQDPEKTEVEPLPQAASKVAEGNGRVAELERATFPENTSTVQTFGPDPNSYKAEIEPPPQAACSVVVGNGNAAELGRVTTSEKKSATQTLGLAPDSDKTEIEPPPQAVSSVAAANGNAAEIERVTPIGKKSTIQTMASAQISQKTQIELSRQAVNEVVERKETASGLERIPLEEIDVPPLSRIVFYTDPRGLAADRFRFLRMRIRELSSATKLQSLLVTSPLPLDGKSTVSLNLATALAEQGQNAVLLLEADLYHPSLAQRLGLKAGPGLAECLASGIAPLSVVRRVAPLGWYFLQAGSQLATPSDLLHGDEFAKIMRALSPHFKWIVIDSPPVLPVADALALARQADASFLVVRAGRTPSDAVQAAIEFLGAKHVMGVILNGVEGLERVYSKYNNYYGYSAATTSAREPSGAAE